MEIEILNTSEINTETREQGVSFDLFTKEQSAVYGILCPKRKTMTIEEIQQDLDIPQRVKEIAEISKDRFYKYEVWGSDLYEVKDPILLGREQDPKNPTYNWYDKFYILARWGNELDSFENLKLKANKIYKDKCVISAIKIKARIDAFLLNPEIFVNAGLNAGIISEPRLDFNLFD